MVSEELTPLLESLTNANGLPGDESEVRGILRRFLRDQVDHLSTDSLGNLLCVKGTGPVRVMLDAHMDEVGLMVSGHDDSGLIRFVECGGLDPRVLPGRAVSVGRPGLPGVIGLQAVHLIPTDERDRTAPVRRLYVDIGAKSREEAASVAPLGTRIYFVTRFERLSDAVIKAKALDDRVGCAAAATLLAEGDYPGLTLIGAFTVQEEVGLRGAQAAGYSHTPDMALVLEGTSAADVPGVNPPDTCSHLGRGPAITIMDGTAVADARLRDRLIALADEHGLPWQPRRLTTAGTNAGALFPQKTGVPACTLAVPCRYIHSPASLAALSDIEAMLRLVRLFLESTDRGEFTP